MLVNFSSLPHGIRDLDIVSRIAGPMRLAKKYDAYALFGKLALLLERDWPREFIPWRRMHRIIRDRQEDFMEEIEEENPGYPGTIIDENALTYDPGLVYFSPAHVTCN